MGQGSDPAECIAKLEGVCAPEQLSSADSEILYQRLCELEALREEVSLHMWRIMNTLLRRKFFHGEIVDEPGGDETTMTVLLDRAKPFVDGSGDQASNSGLKRVKVELESGQ